MPSKYDELISDCLAGETTTGFLASFANEDIIAQAVVANFDLPDPRRFAALREHPDGRKAATSIAVAVVASGDAPETLADIVFNQLDEFAEVLELGESGGKAVVEALKAPAALSDERAGIAFGWLSRHLPDRSRALAMEQVNEAAPTGVGRLLRLELAVLGASDDDVHHAEVISFAQRCADANQPAQSVESLAVIERPVDSDCEAAAQVLNRLLSNGQAIPMEIRTFLGRLSVPQVIRLIEGMALDPAATPQFDQLVMPHLFAVHAAGLVPTITGDLWSASSREWLLSSAPWREHDASLLLRALDLAAASDDHSATKLRGRVVEWIQSADNAAPRTTMPHIGARKLLQEALDGRIIPNDALLQQALNHLSPQNRREEYSSAHWRTPNRARRLGAIVVALDADDVSEELVEQAFGLKDKSAVAWLQAVGPHVEPQTGDAFVTHSKGRPLLLTTLAESKPSADALLRQWENRDDLEAFKALAGSDYDDGERLNHVADAVRAYSSPLTIEQRLELIGELDSGLRAPLLEHLLADRKETSSSSRPPDGLVVGALRVLSTDLTDRDPGVFLQILDELCRTHPRLAVRRAAYEVLGRCRPTTEIVDLLLERKRDDVPSAQGAVEASLDAVSARLTDRVASSSGDEKVEALDLLDDVDPMRALPHARHLLDEPVENPAHRVLAGQLLGRHGDESDLDRLRKAAEHEPDAAARQVLQQAIRQLEIGDIAAAHLRIGELAGIDPDAWVGLQPERIWEGRAEALVAGLNRVNKFQAGGDFGSTVDQLGAEVAKLILYHTIDGTGDDLSLSAADRAGIRDNQLDYGSVVRRQQLILQWEFVGSLGELYRLRSEHLTPKGTWDPVDELTEQEYEHALWLFQRGVRPCLERLAAAT